MRLVGGLLVALLALTGCWPEVGQGPAHRRHNPFESTLTLDNVETLSQAWSVDVSGTPSEPVVWGGRVYVYTREGRAVRAADLGTGATIWETEIWPYLGDAIGVPVAKAGNELWAGLIVLVDYTGQCGAHRHRLDLEDGSTISSVNDESIFSSPVAAGGHVVHTSVEVSEPETGHCLNGRPLNLSVRDSESMVSQWSATVPGDAPSPASLIFAPPTVAHGRVYVVHGRMLSAYSLDGCGASTCEPLWSLDLGADIDLASPVAAEDGRVFVQLTTGEVSAVDSGSGTELWRAPLGATPAFLDTQPMALAGDILYVSVAGTGDGANRLLAFDTSACSSSCSPSWTAPFDTAVTSGPVVAGGVVYVGTNGAVQAFDAAGCGADSCTPMVSLPLQGEVSALSVTQGRLLASSSGRLTAFAPAG